MMKPKERHFGPGEFLFHEGVPSDSMFLIKKGTTSVRKRKGNAYVEVGRVFANEVIGELSFFDRMPRSASVVALTEVDALEISFASLDAIYGNVPDYLKTIMACVADRLRKANDLIRRLQKDVVSEISIGKGNAPEAGESASEVLAATSDVQEIINHSTTGATTGASGPLIDNKPASLKTPKNPKINDKDDIKS